MKRKYHKTDEIIRILRAAEATDLTIEEFCRQQNISEQSFYRWRKKYGSMELSEAKRLKDLEEENARLKKLVADQALDIQMLRDVNKKKW